jgi:hypothetical protein
MKVSKQVHSIMAKQNASNDQQWAEATDWMHRQQEDNDGIGGLIKISAILNQMHQEEDLEMKLIANLASLSMAELCYRVSQRKIEAAEEKESDER